MNKACAMIGGRIDAVFFCPHTGEANCGCRKPKSGMLDEIASRYGVNLKGVPAVGDSLRDLEAAASLEAQPILVLTGKGNRTQAKGGLPENTLIYSDLAAVAAALV
jgi:D-glycero-D-manno-heptose 1,7-bisphosphate phosphatase